MKKIRFILILICFTVINMYTFLLFVDDMLLPQTTVEIINQNDSIVEKVKTHFHLDYEIQKIVYKPSFPDGYFLDIYDFEDKKHEVFEDRHQYDDIGDYFRQMNPDDSKYFLWLVLGVMIEIVFILIVVIKKRWKFLN